MPLGSPAFLYFNSAEQHRAEHTFFCFTGSRTVILYLLLKGSSSGTSTSAPWRWLGTNVLSYLKGLGWAAAITKQIVEAQDSTHLSFLNYPGLMAYQLQNLKGRKKRNKDIHLNAAQSHSAYDVTLIQSISQSIKHLFYLSTAPFKNQRACDFNQCEK